MYTLKKNTKKPATVYKHDFLLFWPREQQVLLLETASFWPSCCLCSEAACALVTTNHVMSRHQRSHSRAPVSRQRNVKTRCRKKKISLNLYPSLASRSLTGDELTASFWTSLDTRLLPYIRGKSWSQPASDKSTEIALCLNHCLPTSILRDCAPLSLQPGSKH